MKYIKNLKQGIKFVKINRIYYIFTFLFVSLLYRILLPAGDEPDFIVRFDIASRIHDNFLFYPYYFISDLFYYLSIKPNCELISTIFSFGSNIDYNTCFLGYDYIFSRWLFTVFTTLPFLILLLLYPLNKDAQYKVDVLLLSFCFSGFIYYVGVLSVDPLFLCISSLVILTVRNFLLSFLLVLLLSTIDIGDSFVVLTFLILFNVIDFIYKRFSIKGCVFFILGVIFFSLIVNSNILRYLNFFSVLEHKSQAIEAKYAVESLRDKYPVFFRPIITYMTIIFFTPNYLKSIISYIIFMVIIAISIRKYNFLVKANFSNNRLDFSIVGIFSYLSLILFFVFTFPDYANGKYYIFAFPFLTYFIAYVIGLKRLYISYMVINIIVLYGLLFYYL